MRTLVRTRANTGRTCGRRMAETAGQFKPAEQHKRCGPSPSLMQIAELLLVKAARSLGPKTEVLIGLANQAEQLFSSVEFGSVMQIMGRLSEKAAPFLGRLTAERAGRSGRAGR